MNENGKYIVYNEKMRGYGFGNNGQVIVKHISEATQYATFGDAMKVAVKYMEFYEDSEFKVISYFEQSPQNELIGLFIECENNKVECKFVTPYQSIIDDYIKKHSDELCDCKFSVKKVPYVID